EPALVELCEEILADVGYEPVGFSSSTQALQRFRADPARFDVVLTDEAMPDLTGAELAREIRRIRPDMPVVLMSGHGGTQLADRAIDLVVLDLRLAGEDGMMIARTLRTESAIPIVMLTGVRDEADRVMGLELGADDYLTKPFSPRELLARIRTVLRRTKSSALT